jgi:hypothetical protein
MTAPMDLVRKVWSKNVNDRPRNRRADNIKMGLGEIGCRLD